MTVISSENSQTLHELADRYDCPPLKLAAWRLLQESVPGYSSSAAGKLLKGISNSKKPKTNGLVGPGEPQIVKISDLQPKKRISNNNDNPDENDDGYNDDGNQGYGASDDDEYDEDGRRIAPSLFFTEEEGDVDVYDEDNYDADGDGGTNQKTPPLRLDQLGPTATAEDVVKAWALRLKGNCRCVRCIVHCVGCRYFRCCR
jgi:hypothetical protein